MKWISYTCPCVSSLWDLRPPHLLCTYLFKDRFPTSLSPLEVRSIAGLYAYKLSYFAESDSAKLLQSREAAEVWKDKCEPLWGRVLNGVCAMGITIGLPTCSWPGAWFNVVVIEDGAFIFSFKKKFMWNSLNKVFWGDNFCKCSNQTRWRILYSNVISFCQKYMQNQYLI